MQRKIWIAGAASIAIALTLVVASSAVSNERNHLAVDEPFENAGGRVVSDFASEGGMEELGTISPGTDMDEALLFENARFVTAGAPMRDTRMGAMNLSGLPPESLIIRAYLYWQWACLEEPVEGIHDMVLFGRVYPTPREFRKDVIGTRVGSGANPCWCGPEYQNVNYRADVTDLITQRQGGIYGVILHQNAAGSTNYSDMWAGSLFRNCEPQAEPPLFNGAALVVVYNSPCEENGTVAIYDEGLAGHMFSPIPGIQFDLAHPPAGSEESSFAFITGDGQVGLGYVPNFGFTNEQTHLNGSPIAGPGSLYNDSQWNGGNGQPLPQLFDVSGLEVTNLISSGSTSTSVSVFSEAGPGLSDCVVPVASVLFTR